MASRTLSAEQLAHYRVEGFLVIDAFFGAEILSNVEAAIRQITDHALNSSDYSKVLELEPEAVDGARVARRIFNPYDQHDSFKALAHDARLLDGIEALIGPDITLQHSKLNLKPPRVGSAVDWHQDMAYFPHTNDDLITVLVYLDDANFENGCLQVLPRHHTHYFNHSLPDGAFAGMITEEIADGRFGRPVPLEAPAGSVIFMHCITPHSSLPNRSPRPRRTLIYEYRAADSFPIYYGDMTTIAEARYRQIRGKPARFARMSGPLPPVPSVGRYQSLYELQEKSRAALIGK